MIFRSMTFMHTIYPLIMFFNVTCEQLRTPFHSLMGISNTVSMESPTKIHSTFHDKFSGNSFTGTYLECNFDVIFVCRAYIPDVTNRPLDAYSVLAITAKGVINGDLGARFLFVIFVCSKPRRTGKNRYKQSVIQKVNKA